MTNQLNGRIEYRPHGKNPAEDLDILIAAVAKSPDLVELNGGLTWIHEGKLLPVSSTTLPEIVRTNLVVKCVADLGDEGAELRYLPVELDPNTAAAVIRGLHGEVPKVPAIPPNQKSIDVTIPRAGMISVQRTAFR